MNELAAAWAAFHNEDFEAAEEAFWQSDSSPAVTREARGGLVYVYARTGRFEEARDLCEALQLEAVALGDLALEYAALHQLGIVERLAGQFETALEVFALERTVIARLSQPPLAVCANAFETGVLHAKLGRLEIGRDWLRIALEAAQLSGDLGAQASVLRALGEVAVNPTMRRALLLQSHAAFVEHGDGDSALEVKALLEQPLH